MDSRILLFGDVIVDKLPALRNVYNLARSRPQVNHFLSAAAKAIKRESVALPPRERLKLSSFDDLLELGEWCSVPGNADSVASATVLGATQISEFLIFAEDDPSILGAGRNHLYQFGVCQGALTATVATAARDTSEIVTYGVEILAILFRMGVHLTRRTKNVEDSDKSWACAVFGIQPKELEKRLHAFNENISPARRAYLGIATSSWTTVFGPPSTIDTLIVHPALQDALTSPLEDGVAVHAPHLPAIDIDSILGESPILQSKLPANTLMSLSSRSCYQADTLGDLLRLVIADIAESLHWVEEGISGLASVLRESSSVIVAPIGPTSHSNLLRTRLLRELATVKVAPTISSKLDSQASHSGNSTDLAVVGMSGRFPHADSLDEFWNLLMAGTDTCEETPPSRFPIDEFYDAEAEGLRKTAARHGCFLKNPGDFDNLFFNISRREALQMDPLQRMLLMTTYEALQMAGYAGESRVATFFGQSNQDWMEVNNQRGPEMHYLPSVVRAFAPGRLNHFFKWTSGYTNIDTACTSSLTALDQARSALLSGECDRAIVSGGSLCVLPEPVSGLSKGGFLSPTGQCKTFQESADGYCRGEAVGVIVVKRLDDALRENDNVLGVIKGVVRSTNAGDISITHPKESTQAELYKKVLRQTGVHPHDVGFIEMHGTGTIAGDVTEMNSVQQVFAQRRPREDPLTVGALKANIGHSEAAAGVVSLIKAILMLQRGQVPPQPHHPFTLNSGFSDLQKANIHIANSGSTLSPPAHGNGRRKILVNGFDAAGGNATVLVEESAPHGPTETDPREYHVVVCSGKTPAALEANKSRLSNFIYRRNTDVRLADIAYTTTARRLHESYRQAFVVKSIAELQGKLATDSSSSRKTPTKTPSLVFVFTGQSAQYAGMASTLYRTCAFFRRTLDQIDEICKYFKLASPTEIFSGKQNLDTASSPHVQLSLVAMQIALARYWESLGITPTVVVGHSLGEYAALHIAGVLSLTDALILVYERAKLIEARSRRGRYKMLAVPLDVAAVDSLATDCELSCINAPAMSVVSGPAEDIKTLQAKLKSSQVGSTELQSAFGFHSSQMDPIVDDFKNFAAKFHFGQPQIPVASTLLGKIVSSSGTFGHSYLAQHMRHPVDFLGAINSCVADGFIKDNSMILEIGPHPVCLSLLTACLADTSVNPGRFTTLSRGQDDWNSISNCLSGAYTFGFTVDWHQFHNDFIHSLRLIELPTYAWELSTFWIPYEERNVHPMSESKSANPTDALYELQSTCVQRVESIETNSEGKLVATFSARTSQPQLHDAIQAHKVDGVAICPASIFVDMAYTCAQFLFGQKGMQVKPSDFELVELNLKHPLVVDANKDTAKTVRITALMDEKTKSIEIHFHSPNEADKTPTDLGACEVFITTGSGTKLWSRVHRMVHDRASSLQLSSLNGSAHRILKPLAYRLFGATVEYGVGYQAMKEVHVEDQAVDAVAHLQLPMELKTPGSFALNPYHWDAIVHLSGFLLNGGLGRPADALYIANRVGSARVFRPLAAGQELTCYCSINEDIDGSSICCDVYVYSQAEVYAIFTDISFTKLRRDVFKMLTSSMGVPQIESATRKTIPEGKKMLRTDTVPKAQTNSQPLTSSQPMAMPTPPQANKHDIDLAEVFIDIVADQTGIPRSEISELDDFASMGMDSQMSIAVVAEMKKRTEVALPTSFFLSFSTVAEAQSELGQDYQPAENKQPVPQTERNLPASASPRLGAIDHSPESYSTSETAVSVTPSSVEEPSSRPRTRHDSFSEEDPKHSKPLTSHTRHDTIFDGVSKTVYKSSEDSDAFQWDEEIQSNAVLLHGQPKSRLAPLFLLPDESGEATSYLHVPTLPERRRVYALESPFVDEPEKYNVSVGELAEAFMTTIRSVQPNGPYLIGGWSIGAVYAYEVARQLVETGKEVAGLLILDMKCPGPEKCFNLAKLDYTSLPSGRAAVDKSPDTLARHVKATATALSKYLPTPCASKKCPHQVFVMSTVQNLSEGQEGTMKTDESRSVTTDDHNVDDDGWKRLVGSQNVHVRKIIVTDNDSIMELPQIRGDTSRFILEAIESFVSTTNGRK